MSPVGLARAFADLAAWLARWLWSAVREIWER
jgi:hypothetical protein